ncbi:hypothetical protein BDZ91DRAFT_781054 [Kalaharituber pfeilii]|nr:hypothetical protein BDZ91DRAFT_781054 [Kalaharituber pfeilii]
MFHQQTSTKSECSTIVRFGLSDKDDDDFIAPPHIYSVNRPAVFKEYIWWFLERTNKRKREITEKGASDRNTDWYRTPAPPHVACVFTSTVPTLRQYFISLRNDISLPPSTLILTHLCHLAALARHNSSFLIATDLYVRYSNAYIDRWVQLYMSRAPCQISLLPNVTRIQIHRVFDVEGQDEVDGNGAREE